MKILLSIAAILLSFNSTYCQGKDYIYLKDNSVLKGKILSINPETDVRMETDCCGTVTVPMEKVFRIEANGVNIGNPQHNQGTISNEKKEERKDIWLDITGKVVTTVASEIQKSNTKDQPAQGQPENAPEEASPNEGGAPESSNPSTPPANTGASPSPASSTPSGNVCITNPNFYSRRIKLTHSISHETKELLVQSKMKGCLYDLPTGTYNYEVYNTFSRWLIVKAQIQITHGKTTDLVLPEDNTN